MKRIRSLRARMTLLFTLATTGLMLLLSGAILGTRAYQADRAAERALTATARRVRDELVENRGLKGPSEMVREEGELLEQVDGAMLILDRQGQVLAKSRGEVPRWPRQEEDGWRVLALRAPEGTVVIGMSSRKTWAALRSQAVLVLSLVLLVGLVTALGAWALVGRTLAPIQLLSRQANVASADSLRVRLEAPSGDAELVELVATLNGLLERLSHTAAARGRFYAAASHELRTPLQALSGHLELALTRPRSEGEYQAVVEEAYGQARRLTHLVRELLLLNQLHQETSKPPPEPVDLCGMTHGVLGQFRATFLARGLRVEADLPDGVEIHAPPAHAEIILRNLVENAAKYAVPGTTVHLEIAAMPGGARFEIANECPETLTVRPEQVFEPFFRPDASRSSRTGGNGLGLAICKAVAVAHGWSLEWVREEKGVRASVVFPAPDEREPAGAARAESPPCPEVIPAVSR